MIYSAYNKAGEVILDQVAKQKAALAKSNKDSQTYKFWDHSNEVLIYALRYIEELEMLVRETNLIREENRILKLVLTDLENRLKPFEVIQAELTAGTLDAKIEIVRESGR
jgi:hypothetical protein